MRLNVSNTELQQLGEEVAATLHLSHQADNLLLGLPSGHYAIHHLEQALANINVLSHKQNPNHDIVYPALIVDIQGDIWLYTDDYACDYCSNPELSRERNIVDIEPVVSWYLTHKKVTDKRAEQLHKRVPNWLLPVWQQIRPYYRALLIGSLTINMLALVVPLFTMNVYDRVVPNAALDTLWMLALGACIAVAFDWLLKQSRSHLTDAAGRQIDLRVSSKMFSRVLGMRLEHRPLSSGAYAKQVQDFDTVREFITSATLVSVVDLPFTLLFIGLIAWLGGAIVLVPITVLTLVILLSLILQSHLSQSVEESAKLSTQRQAYLIENLNQLVELKQANGQAKAQEKLEQTLSQMVDWQIQARHSASTMTHSVMGLSQLNSIALIVVGVYLISAGQMSMGALIAIVMISGRASNSIASIASLLLKYRQTKTAMESVKSILMLDQEQKPGDHTIDADLSGQFTARHLGFKYQDHDMDALYSLNFDIQTGEKIGLYGNAGSGKSTLLAILAGQYQGTAGQLLIDDIDIRHWSLSALRRQTGWVSQNPNLFFGSVLENITLGMNNIAPEKLASALTQSGVTRFIDRLESGLETQVGEFGRNLSGGQRQAVSVARALLHQRSVLLLDEPSSSMDNGQERQLIETLKQRRETLVIASHRKELLQLCDRIFVLDHGRLKSIETPASLFKSTSSKVRLVSKRVEAVSPK
ncbi:MULTISPECIES: ATP-binding cassette domain-containing protein [unclassified Vibrio]|uniref:ATP-binding cassette domain-containing protein n=1 Tax=Vibrio sp. HB236076 TaxID=3232307 RepID=A0AB39HBJ7_9VIBR|nr:ATP-binding cassette domain-containing protein [Vibrio sp. HB161653]MDP5253902.1 ATP-binding cassette domain-containing protein [Vibrio sp. HB161653]